MKIQFKNIIWLLAFVLIAFTVQSCEDFEQFEPAGANSKADQTPPMASFSYSQGQGDGEVWKDYTFANLSTSATTYMWEFEGGGTSSDVDAEFTFPGEGMYAVSLTASDALGVVSVFSDVINVVEPEEPEAIVPEILEASFEDNSLAGGSGDGRDSWRNSALGGVIQITSSPVQNGSQAAKFPSAGDRIAYQELSVSPNSDYVLTYYYTLKTNNPGSVTVSVLADGGHADLATALAAKIEDFEGTDQTSSSNYVQGNISFNTGANSVISILITNQGEEARVDNFSIAAQ
ncbi:PKD domain-containing protein [Flavobacteriaceae bacterium]|nr:PKD domain-containing protein [Flavobacteriaceae bacterium]|tara:strand:- start:6742 stop:7608 length:867 start_codon:yes stop_codon:yes gene_type:complete